MKYSDESDISIHFIDEAPDYLAAKVLTVQTHRQNQICVPEKNSRESLQNGKRQGLKSN
jgi:hypothetical protein